MASYGSLETRDTVIEKVMVEVHDTIREVTTITVQQNEAGDTLKLIQVTNRERARERAQTKDKSEKLTVVRDTVYVGRCDSSYISTTNFTNGTNSRASPFVTGVKWLVALVCSIIVLLIIIRFAWRK